MVVKNLFMVWFRMIEYNDTFEGSIVLCMISFNMFKNDQDYDAEISIHKQGHPLWDIIDVDVDVD